MDVLRCISRWELLQQIASGMPTDAVLFSQVGPLSVFATQGPLLGACWPLVVAAKLVACARMPRVFKPPCSSPSHPQPAERGERMRAMLDKAKRLVKDMDDFQMVPQGEAK